MYLVKSCFKFDNIFKRQTLKIGSLSEYRQTEEDQIADKEEGTMKHIYNLYDFHMPEILLNALTSYANSESSFHMKRVVFAGYSPILRHHRYLKIYEAETNLINLNRFTFCISKLKHPSFAKDIFKNYNDAWYLPASYATIFTETLAKEVFDEIKRRLKLGEDIFQDPPTSTNISIRWHVEDIHYTDREIFIDNISLYKNHNFLTKTLWHSYMLKPKTFQKEQEVRFVFDIYCEDKLLIPKEKYLIVNAEKLLPLIKSV